MTKCKYKKMDVSKEQVSGPFERNSSHWYEDEQDLMGKIPSIVQRISLIVMLSVAFAILGVCFFVKCPETVQNGKIIYSNQTIMEYILREVICSIKK